MLKIALLYVFSLMLFLGADSIGLRYIVRPVFADAIGPLLLDNFRIGPALVFYLFYIAGLVWFVSAPSMAQGHGLAVVFALGAFIGALAYGTYEFTNFATLKDWTPKMVAVDLVWGTVLTGFAAAGGVALTRLFTT